MDDCSILAIVPARGNSKRFPGKNLAELAGKPLIAHTIEAATVSGVFADIYVTSDSDNILAAAKLHGASALKRPENLAGDDIALAPVCLHVLEELEAQGKTYDAIALLQPTAPLRTAQDIRNAYDIFTAKDCDAVLSVFKAPHPPQRTLLIEDDTLKPAPGADMEKQSQEFDDLYMSNGAVNLIRTDVFRSKKTFFVLGAAPYLLQDTHAVDIDDELQLKWAEFLLRQKG